jgi:hypothetical protein
VPTQTLEPPKGLAESEVNWALGQCLHRCSRPGCRQRGQLKFHALARAAAPPDIARFVVLCADCRRCARRGEFSTHRMQTWKSHLMEYWDNVGAE